MIDAEFRNVCKTYNPGLFKKKVLAVNELNLAIQKGEVFGLIGPNGAGKSTTIRMLLGLIRPSHGEIYFGGKPLVAADIQKKIGYLPENPYLYDHLTLYELLTFSGKTSGLTGKQIHMRSDELLTRLDLSSAAKRPLRSFSKGMLQRAGICFAMMHDPEMLILDEPMSGLDPIGRKMVFDLVTELKDRGKTIFFCSHILSDVERLCDRIGIMFGGRLVDELEGAVVAREMKASVTLEVSDCSETLLEKLNSLAERIVAEDSHHLVNLSVSNLYAALQTINALDAVVLACRSDQASLEKHFLRIIRGNTK